MNYRQLLESIAERHGFWARPSYDGDYDIIIDVGNPDWQACREDLDRVGFRTLYDGKSESGMLEEYHIHSPKRLVFGESRGWDVEVQ